jgi:hypothetical protein
VDLERRHACVRRSVVARRPSGRPARASPPTVSLRMTQGSRRACSTRTSTQMGGSRGLAVVSTVSTIRLTSALHGGAALPVPLTHASGACLLWVPLRRSRCAGFPPAPATKSRLSRTNPSRRRSSRFPAARTRRPVATSRASRHWCEESKGGRRVFSACSMGNR